MDSYAEGGQLVAHFLNPTKYMGAVFHNRPLHLNQKVSIPFVYARIAHAVLPGLIPFLMNGCPREVKVVNISGGIPNVVEEQMTESKLANLLGPPKSNASTPKKRKSCSDGTDGNNRQCKQPSTPSLTEDEESSPGNPRERREAVGSRIPRDAKFEEDERLYVLYKKGIERARSLKGESVCCEMY